ncbi:hypothetical protein V8G54_035333 [Vigna mungo]|uniref:hydroxyacylglutathione hydrolase n=1 Tax=Vigna mungo TaxID=3915 RepID=A0AAQ3MGD6_VIGMU
MKIQHIPCLEDNYSYLIVDETTKEAAAVDPVEPEKILEAANSRGVTLKLVLTTHHHWDHAGGNEKIKQLVPGIKVYGGSIDNVKGCTDMVENGDKVSLGADVTILALHTPCHTKGHISYYVTGKEDEHPAVFTGDTLPSQVLEVKVCDFYLVLSFKTFMYMNFEEALLSNLYICCLVAGLQFIASCGKFFEGTAEQMYQSLNVTLGSLPKTTRVYCGHEYSVKNLQFALTLEPDNSRTQQKLTWAQNQRQAGQATIPSTIDDELETNPFMRVDLPEIQERVGCKSPVEALGEIRKRKDNWRG